MFLQIDGLLMSCLNGQHVPPHTTLSHPWPLHSIFTATEREKERERDLVSKASKRVDSYWEMEKEWCGWMHLACLISDGPIRTLWTFFMGRWWDPLCTSQENGWGEITDENHSKTGRCQQAGNDTWWPQNPLSFSLSASPGWVALYLKT